MPEVTPEKHEILDYTSDEGRDKLLAETEKLKTEIASLRQAMEGQTADNERADAKHAIEIESLQILRDRGKLSREVDQIVRDRNVREERMILACDWNHQIYNFSEPVDQDTVQQCMTQINQWVRQYEAELRRSADIEKLKIEIVFDSPGGNLFDGMHLFDHIRITRAKGYDITAVALGNAASMAGILVQAGTTRVIGKESYLLIHKMSEFRFMDSATSDEVHDRLERLKKMDKRVLEIFAERAATSLSTRPGATVTYDEAHQATRELIEKKWSKNDWWIDSDEALALGLVDSIR